MSDPRPMNPPKPNRRKPGANKLEPIDWHEYANDAVLNGNMSTLFQRPASEDPSAYASPEALVEIEKRQAAANSRPSAGLTGDTACPTDPTPTAVGEPAEGAGPTVGTEPAAVPEAGSHPGPHVPGAETGRLTDDEKRSAVPVDRSSVPLGMEKGKKVKPIRDVHDAL